MKKTQFKDALRTVKKQFVSFLSIVVIAALAVGSIIKLFNRVYSRLARGRAQASANNSN